MKWEWNNNGFAGDIKNLYKDSTSELYYQGLKELSVFNLDKAVDYFSKVIKLKKDFKEAYLMRGMAYSEKEMFKESIRDLSRAIELNPHDYEAYDFRGYTYLLSMNYEKACSDFKTSFALNPKNNFSRYYMNWLKDKFQIAI